MIAAYILKPDMIHNDQEIQYYFEELMKIDYIKILNTYYIDDWINISKLIYEKDDKINSTLDNNITTRKQLLTTMKGYDYYYQENMAFVNLIQIVDGGLQKIIQLDDLKRLIRKKFVRYTDKHYLKFLNESNIDFSKKFINQNLKNIDAEFIKIKYDADFSDNDFNMIFFNHIHFPDPNKDDIESNIQILQDCNIFNKNNKVKVKINEI